MQFDSSYYDFAKEFVTTTNQNIFLTGKAGTGKTTFLKNLKEECTKQMAIVAPTGVAAINATGSTIHSFFQLPFTPYLPTPEGKKRLLEKIKMQGHKRKVIQELELLVIDEISMVRADVLDAIDCVLRHIRYRLSEAFGGVQVLFIGDMFQLSPVVSDDEWRLLSSYYQGPYFFQSQVLSQKQPVYIELDKIFRQSNTDFINVLNDIRNNTLSNDSLSILRDRYNPAFLPAADENYITLTTHNHKADRINADEIGKINGKTYKFNAIINGEFSEKSYPTEKTLELKIGAKVMFIKNDLETPRRFYNGKIGTISEMNDDKITIECPNDSEPIELGRMTWENIRYSTNEATKQIEEEVIGKFVQFPLRLAWAITIHKSQGLTFDKAIIDAGDAFAPGQVYVALSRCRSLDGLVLWSKLNPSSFETDRNIVAYESNKCSANQLQLLLNKSQNQFRIYILNQLFDYRTGMGFANKIISDINEQKDSFNEEALPFLEEVQKQLQSLNNVALKFQFQLQEILLSSDFNEDFLTQRLQAASSFFENKSNILLETLTQSPASTDSREKAREFNEQLHAIYSLVAQKCHILRNVQLPFQVENYYETKNSFRMPEIKINAYSKSNATKTISSRNPKLFFELLELRNQLCEPDNLPIYLVAGTKTLVEMADFLPLTTKDLLKVSGFGPKKVEKYGPKFLEIILKYSEAHQLQTSMFEKEEIVNIQKRKPSKEEKKEKKPKGETYRITLELYKSGKTVDEIVELRGLAPSTIYAHLARYIELGEISIDDFIQEDKLKEASKLLENKDNQNTNYEILAEVIGKYEIGIFLSWYRRNKETTSLSEEKRIG